MQNPLGLFATRLRSARVKRRITQRQLAEKLHMSIRTIIKLECCKSSPRFETAATLAREMEISIDAVVFQELNTETVSKSVIAFFADKSGEEIEKYLMLCRQAESFKGGKDD